MTISNFGDIILVPFPFTDQTTTKKRPAVVFSFSEYNPNLNWPVPPAESCASSG